MKSDNPITDWFGTILSADALVDGLSATGLRNARLLLRDDGLRLEFSDGSYGDDAPSTALTWIRSQFSPLFPAELTRVDGLNGIAVEDSRHARTRRVWLAELIDPDEFTAYAATLLDRSGARGREHVRLPATSPDDRALAAVLVHLADVWSEALSDRGLGEIPLRWAGPNADLSPGCGDGPELVVWFRPGGARGVAPAFVLALTESGADSLWLAEALAGRLQPREDLLLDGLAWGASRRPTVASPASDNTAIVVDSSRCDGCGVCAEQCPVGYLDAVGEPTTPDVNACIRCFECIDACPVDALRPSYGPDCSTSSRTLTHRPRWLERLRDGPGGPVPAPFTPSYLLAETTHSRARVVLGVAVLTMQEHAAALVIDGEVVGAVEEEKLARDRHYGWRSEERPEFVTPTVDPTICIEEVLCRRSIRWLLSENGLSLDDVDVIAVNGLHARFRRAFSLTDAQAELPTLRSGRVIYVPHHLSHAASAYRVSDNDGGWIFTVDGRGDRETAAVFEVVDGEIVQRRTLLSLTDRSIGGVYEGFTRLLGFGSHGQGSLMALAGFGEPTVDVGRYLCIADDGTATIHESGLNEEFAAYARPFERQLEETHFNLAASIQAALETAAVRFVASAIGPTPPGALALAGGVSLNCHMNERLRRHFGLASLFVQPGANDGGTAIGAAAEAVWVATGQEKLTPMRSAGLGPSFEDETVRKTLEAWGVPFQRVDGIGSAVAARVADGQVVAWFQGELEFGPRALGARSIVADPRSASVKDRVNALKDRQDWRPFGPSVLAGFEGEWFEEAFDSRFMLFTMRVLDRQRERIPAVMHVDGTTRPQMVHPEAEPEYHSMIAAFHRLTNIPMILNTSFNRRGEPIVATPEDALAAFWELRCDALAIGPYLVDHPAPLRLDVPRTALAPLQRPQAKRPQARRWVLYSSDEATNDRFSGSVGSFRRVLNEAQREPGRLSPRTLHTPIVHGDLSDLARLVLIAQKFDATLVLAYPEPARTHHGLAGDGWVPLKTAVRIVSACVSLASKRNVDVRVEGFPLCLLGPGIRPLQAPVDTPHMKVPPKRCGACSALAECPTLWPGHHEAFGAAELTPVASD